MNSQSLIKKKLIILCLVLLTVPMVMLLQVYYSFPGNLLLLEGQEYTYEVETPITIDAEVNKSGVLSLNGNVVKDKYSVNLNSPFTIKPKELGSFNLNLKLFGVIPFRSVNVNVIPNTNIVPCGNTIGVKLYTDGILVIGTSEVNGLDGEKYFPWKEAGIKEGDIIESVDNKKVKDIEHLVEILQKSQGNEINIRIKREQKYIEAQIMPVKSMEDKTYKIGLWVRDSTAGIGTLTFYDPQNHYFGALGHGITDIDTGKLLTVGRGTILKSSVISVRKGKKGKPGELKGVFMQQSSSLGEIKENSEYGIFGKIYGNISTNSRTIKPMPIAVRSRVEEGKAYILSNIKGEKVEKFDIEIQKVFYQSTQNSKSMVIKITDPKLIETTGGIVQGMSGSPIIQNGRLVGAVTHVFVNDPTRGYGIFIDQMLKKTADLAR